MQNIRFFTGNGCFLYGRNRAIVSYKSFITNSFALSILEVSIDARYICVVETESWPRASDMTLMGIFLFLAIVAQVWRVTYVVSGVCRFAIRAMAFSALLMRRNADSLCLSSEKRIVQVR